MGGGFRTWKSRKERGEGQKCAFSSRGVDFFWNNSMKEKPQGNFLNTNLLKGQGLSVAKLLKLKFLVSSMNVKEN